LSIAVSVVAAPSRAMAMSARRAPISKPERESVDLQNRESITWPLRSVGAACGPRAVSRATADRSPVVRSPGFRD
jgi:hypothetical protein